MREREREKEKVTPGVYVCIYIIDTMTSYQSNVDVE